MGVYLSKPIKDKVSSDCENSRLKCGASSMQGWRVAQEDAHNCCLDFDTDCSLFAVYDGHGGHDVAEYTAANLPDYIKNNEFYKKKDFEKALIDSFLGFDATLKTEAVIAELKKIAAKGKEEKSPNDSAGEMEDDSDEGIDNVEKLKEEAVMPISDVMAQYAGLARAPALRRLTGDKNTPISPVIKAKTSKSDSSVVSDNEVSSSNDASADHLVNGLKDEADRNGDIQEEGCSGSGTSKTEIIEDNVPSSSHNGEVLTKDDPIEGGSQSPVSSQGSERVAKKKAAASMFSKLLEDTSDESDSDNDESFHVSENIASSDEDENGNEGEDDMAEKAEDEEEEEDEEDNSDEEDDEDEEDEDEEEDLEEGFELKDLDEPGRDSGCTAVVALVVNDALYVANAGDSRAILSRKGEAIDLSLDHKPEDGPEMERIIAAGGRVTGDGRVNGGLNLSRAFGDHTYKQVSSMSPTEQMIIALPDVKKEVIDPYVDEFVVLACDGIWNSMTSQEVVDFVRPLILKGEKLSSICEKLFDRCLAPDTLGDGTGCDNMTCVIVQFLGDKKNGEKTNKRNGSPVPGNDSKKPKVDS